MFQCNVQIIYKKLWLFNSFTYRFHGNASSDKLSSVVLIRCGAVAGSAVTSTGSLVIVNLGWWWWWYWESVIQCGDITVNSTAPA